jgi:hypothetical protein
MSQRGAVKSVESQRSLPARVEAEKLTFGKVVNSGEKAGGEDDLKGDGKAPVERGVDEGESKVDPVGNGGSGGNHGCLNADEETTVVGARSLGNP